MVAVQLRTLMPIIHQPNFLNKENHEAWLVIVGCPVVQSLGLETVSVISWGGGRVYRVWGTVAGSLLWA